SAGSMATPSLRQRLLYRLTQSLRELLPLLIRGGTCERLCFHFRGPEFLPIAVVGFIAGTGTNVRDKVVLVGTRSDHRFQMPSIYGNPLQHFRFYSARGCAHRL